MTEIAALVLAAGTASRYRAAGGAGPSKLVANYRGEPLVRRAARLALASARTVIVVTGHARADVEAALEGLPLKFAHNPEYETGIASSLKTGLAALPATVDAALVLLGDMPDVPADAVARLIEAFAANPQALAVAPLIEGRRGNPVLLSRALFPRVEKLTGDEGARRLLAGLSAGELVEIAFEAPGVARDVDTPGDLGG